MIIVKAHLKSMGLVRFNLQWSGCIPPRHCLVAWMGSTWWVLFVESFKMLPYIYTTGWDLELPLLQPELAPKVEIWARLLDPEPTAELEWAAPVERATILATRKQVGSGVAQTQARAMSARARNAASQVKLDLIGLCGDPVVKRLLHRCHPLTNRPKNPELNQDR